MHTLIAFILLLYKLSCTLHLSLLQEAIRKGETYTILLYLQMDNAVVTMIPFIGMEPSPPTSPSPIPPLPPPPPRSSTPSSESESATSQGSSANMRDVTSSSDETSDDNSLDQSLEADNISCQEADTNGQENGPVEVPASLEQARSVNTGYKLVFDNIDKNVNPRHMRSDNQTRSLHYVQVYAVRDRVNFDGLSNERRTEVNVFDILPTDEDYMLLKKNFSILISRMIVKFLPFFSSDFKGLPTKHIPHEHSTEMAKKSEIVSIPNF